eukprot:Opistho-2@12340
MCTDKLADATPEMISQLWVKYHIDKKCVSAAIPSGTYQRMHMRASECPLFVYPLPREDGYEMFLGQFSGHQCFFTGLLEYKSRQESATPRLTLTHYVNFRDTKGLVLMVGHCQDPLTPDDARLLAHQVQLYYATSPENYKTVLAFNKSPSTFDHRLLIDGVNAMIKAAAEAAK